MLILLRTIIYGLYFPFKIKSWIVPTCLFKQKLELLVRNCLKLFFHTEKGWYFGSSNIGLNRIFFGSNRLDVKIRKLGLGLGLKKQDLGPGLKQLARHSPTFFSSSQVDSWTIFCPNYCCFTYYDNFVIKLFDWGSSWTIKLVFFCSTWQLQRCKIWLTQGR